MSKIYDNLIILIERLVKRLISDSKSVLNMVQVNKLIPNYIGSSIKNIVKMFIMVLLERNDIRNIDELKIKLISVLQNNLLTDHLLKNNDLESSTKIIEGSTKILDNEIKMNLEKAGIKSINDVKLTIPNFLSDVIQEMSTKILSNIMLFDENGNIVKTNNIKIIKDEFTNILEKYNYFV